jgi:hypothetical protein
MPQENTLHCSFSLSYCSATIFIRRGDLPLSNHPDSTLRLYTERPIDSLWERLSLYESNVLAKRLIDSKAKASQIEINDHMLDSKATALSYCLRTAKELVMVTSDSITTNAIANYYACLWLIAAIAASQPDNTVDLPYLEKHTKQGHGLQNVANESGTFPDSEFVYLRESGLLAEILHLDGIDHHKLKALAPRKIKDFSATDSEDKQLLVSLSDLFARVPEVKDLYEKISGRRSMCFALHQSGLNSSENSEDMREMSRKGMFGMRRQRDYTWVALIGSADLSEQTVRDDGPPLSEIQLYKEVTDSNWIGKLHHQPDKYWFECIKTYRSTLTGTIWIKPLLQTIENPLVFHMMLLYTLSILARYRPAVWREIIEGNFDYYGGLIQAYNRIFARIIPELVLARITNQRVHVISPGSLHGPA